MLDLSRVKSTKETIVIVQQDKYPNDAVLTTLPVVGKKRPTIKLNRKAMEVLGVSDEANRLIMFPEYNISQTEDAEYDSVIGVVKDAIVKGPKKQHKSFQIHLATRFVKSTDIHNSICTLFELSNSDTNEFYIKNVEGLDGAYVLNHIEEVAEDAAEVEVEFNKGEGIPIVQQ